MRKLPSLPKPRKPALKHRSPIKKTTARQPRENISAHEYSPETGHLTVTFGGGRKYRYENVSPDEAKAFADAPSRGRFLNGWSSGIKIGD